MDDVDYLSKSVVETAAKSSQLLALVLYDMARKVDPSVKLEAVQSLQLTDLQPLLASGQRSDLEDAVLRVLERVRFSEFIPWFVSVPSSSK